MRITFLLVQKGNVSVNANMSGCRPVRGAPKLKKLKASPIQDSFSVEPSGMEVDVHGCRNVSSASEIDCDEETCKYLCIVTFDDCFLIKGVSLGPLKRRRKDEFLEPYTATSCRTIRTTSQSCGSTEATIATRGDII